MKCSAAATPVEEYNRFFVAPTALHKPLHTLDKIRCKPSAVQRQLFAHKSHNKPLLICFYWNCCYCCWYWTKTNCILLLSLFLKSSVLLVFSAVFFHLIVLVLYRLLLFVHLLVHLFLSITRQLPLLRNSGVLWIKQFVELKWESNGLCGLLSFLCLLFLRFIVVIRKFRNKNESDSGEVQECWKRK